MSYLLNVIYFFLLLAALPLLLYRCLVLGKYRRGLSQKILGLVPARLGDKKCLWFHAVSVGEVIQLEGVLKGLQESHPNIDLVLSTTTSTGYDVAKEKYPGIPVFYMPYDFTWSVKNAFRRIRPSTLILVELELWPNLIFETRRRNVTLGLVNGRLSEKSFRGYRRIRPLICRLLSCFRFIAAQNETYAQKLEELGAEKSRIAVTGSIKYDRIETDRDNPKTEELRKLFQIEEGETVWVVGSTHETEEEHAIHVWKSLREKHPQLRLILVPRHKERFDHVARLLDRHQVTYLRRSDASQIHHDNLCSARPVNEALRFGRAKLPLSRMRLANSGSAGASPSQKPQFISDRSLQPDNKPIVLLDTLGELAACWGLADIAYVGGSLTSRGGQNMIEPAAYGAALMFGPNTQNFRATVEMLLDEDAAIVVRSPDELRSELEELLQNSLLAKELGRKAQKTVLKHRGATRKTLELIVANCLSAGSSAEKTAENIAA